MKKVPWFVSLHGGHSSDYCDHASDRLSDMIQAAVDRGMTAFGISEHAPRFEAHHLYPEEVAMGWTIAKIQEDFERYACESREIVRRYAQQIELLRAFEIEVAPRGAYIDRMKSLRQQYGFDYIVGSVHYVNEQLFDHRDMFANVVHRMGGLEKLILAYYEQLTEMVDALCPEVVAHLDVYRKYAGNAPELESPAVKAAAERALDVVQQCGSILDVNTGAYRKGLDTPYPAPWLIHAAQDRGIPFCFGDDSHCCADVGSGIARARDYLVELGVRHICVLTRSKGGISRKEVPLV